MKKTYESHELAYCRMQAGGIESWGQFRGNYDDPDQQIDADTERFMTDALAQPWAPKNGKAIELGCGTAPILRWLNDRGFTGLGVDVSKTAVAMARAQSKGRKLSFTCADICALKHGAPMSGAPMSGAPLSGAHRFGRESYFDLAVDGCCFHCITGESDRRAFLNNVHRLLKPRGLFLIATMCRPVSMKVFNERLPGQTLLGNIIYVPFKEAGDYGDARLVKGRLSLPTRYIEHWKTILKEIRRAGFKIQLFRYNAPAAEEPIGFICVAALVP